MTAAIYDCWYMCLLQDDAGGTVHFNEAVTLRKTVCVCVCVCVHTCICTCMPVWGGRRRSCAGGRGRSTALPGGSGAATGRSAYF